MEYEIVYTEKVERWIDSLRDPRAAASISYRIDRIQEGNFGDHKSVGKRVSELRINTGKGYRIYYTVCGLRVVLLLCGGDKKSQSKDIRLAQEMTESIWRSAS
jgi:putative addiction module killer protein